MATTITDRSGTYNFQSLRIGTYVVSGTKTGFGHVSNRPFSLEIDQIAKIDIKLRVGDVSATVEVTADSGSILQTEDASLRTTITASTLDSMPLPGQNFATATVLGRTRLRLPAPCYRDQPTTTPCARTVTR